MRVMSIMFASALALTSSVALAQTAPGGTGATPRPVSPATPAAPSLGGPGAAQAPQAQPAVNPLTQEDVARVTGTAVYGRDSKKIGSISHVLMSSDKKIDRLVVAEGGLLGVGSHHVAMPIDQFNWDQQQGGFKISKTADELKSMAEWQDPSRRTTSGSGSSAPVTGSAGMTPARGDTAPTTAPAR